MLSILKKTLFFIGYFFLSIAISSESFCEELRQNPSEHLPEHRISRFLDDTHSYISDTIRDIANNIDTFFVDERIDEELQSSRVRIRLGTELTHRGEYELWQRVRANIDLPRTEHRLNLVIDSFFKDEEYPADMPQPVVRAEDEDNSVNTALRYLIRETKNERLHFSAGLSVRPEPVPYLKTRWSDIFPLRCWAFRPTQFFFWESQEGFGETTRLDIDRSMFQNALLRLRGEVTWSETRTKADFMQSLSFSQTLSELKGYGISLNADGHIHPATVENYRLSFTYKRAIYRNWLFFQVEPGIDFPREWNYEASFGIAFQIEGIFGNFES